MNKIPYKFCPKCGGDLKQELPFKFVCAKCAYEFFINPAPCVGILLHNEKGELLLGRRAREPYKNTWDTIGGFVDMRESLEEAAIRELQEETGLVVTTIEYVGSNTGFYLWGGVEQPILNFYVTAHVEDYDHMKPMDDVSELQFFVYDDIPFNAISQKHLTTFLQQYTKEWES